MHPPFKRLLSSVCFLGTCTLVSAQSLGEFIEMPRTLGQTGVHQFEFNLRLEMNQPDMFGSTEWTSLEAPLPTLAADRLWITTDDVGLHHLHLHLTGETPWVDALFVEAPDGMEGTSVPEPGMFALVFAVAALAWVTLQRQRLAVVPIRS